MDFLGADSSAAAALSVRLSFYWFFSKSTINTFLAKVFSVPGRTPIVHSLRSAGKIGFPAVRNCQDAKDVVV